MKISYRWLQDYVDCGHVPVEQLADMLTMAGLEIEGVEHLRFAVPESVVVGKILQVEKHAEASNLFVCQVHLGAGEPLTIVCGAPNTTVGVNVPVALPETQLPHGMLVKTATIRGVASHGMICAEDELGLSDDHSGIIILADDAPLGKPVTREMFAFEDDTVLEIGLTPNRGDCLSHIGVAREVATLLSLPLKKPAIDYPESDDDIAQQAAVFIQDPDLCYRYTAGLISNVTIGPSPLWLRRRLESVGVRAINNIVDVTNYVMMELGQPLHAFDFDTVADRKIIVRRARPDEIFTTLDDVDRQMDEEMLMIADGQRSVAIGGVMGGQNSEVSETTTSVLLESAYFSPASIRKTSKTLGLSTEASYRFERYIDLLSVDVALKRATQLIAEFSGGTVCQGIIDEFPYAYTPTTITLRPQRVNKILGVDISEELLQSILSRLGFTVTPEQSDGKCIVFTVEVPSFRPDVTREIDLIEEIGRIYGYNNIPTLLPSGEIPPTITNPSHHIELLIKHLLVSHGMHEVISYSFFDRNSLAKLLVDDQAPYNQVVPLKNPLTVEQDVLRTTLIPGLIETCALNSSRAESLRFFEVGRVFFKTDPSASLPEEHIRIGGLLGGTRFSRGWNTSQEAIDFYDIKGVVENVLCALNLVYEFRPTKKKLFLHPGESADIYLKEQVIGHVGKLHPDVIENFQLDKDHVFIFELSLVNIIKNCSLTHEFCSLPKFPAVHRDLAVVVPEAVRASQVENVIREAGTPLLESVVLFDRYVGPQISDNAVGLTFSLTYRSLEKTLVDDEVTQVHRRIIERLDSQLRVVLR